MMSLLATLFKTLVGGLPAVVSEISKQKVALANSDNEKTRIEAEENIKTLEMRRDIIIQSQKERWGEFVRFLWALPFIIYVWKLILWDKVFGMGATDPLSPTLEYILWTVLGGYFMLAATKIISRR